MARPTIHDVAARAGVSKSLVSLALQGSPRVSDTSRAAILTAAAELGYRPNAAARSLAARHSRTIGVLLLDLHNPMSADVVDGIQREVRTHGYSTLLVTGGRDAAAQRVELEALLQLQVEGLILVSHDLSAAEVRRLAREVPTVVVTRRDISVPGLDTVSNDDVAGTGHAVDHLVDLGHRRIAHLTGGDDPVAVERERGYREAMARHGLTREVQVVAGSLTDAGGYAAAARVLTARPRPTGLVVANDFAAMGALAAAADAGLRVPADLSVVGYDGISVGALRSVDLTSVAQPLVHMGELAAQRIFTRIERAGTDDAATPRAQHLRVDAALVVRGTTAPAP